MRPFLPPQITAPSRCYQLPFFPPALPPLPPAALAAPASPSPPAAAFAAPAAVRRAAMASRSAFVHLRCHAADAYSYGVLRSCGGTHGENRARSVTLLASRVRRMLYSTIG